MRNNWGREDKGSFANSEVMQELEKKVLETIQRADILAKKAEDAQKMKDLASATNQAAEATERLNEAMGNSAEDGESNDVDNEEDVTNEVIDDLRSLAKAAISEGNYKLAYKIERTIGELTEEEVSCI